MARLDTLDEECATLNEELVQVESNRETLVCDLRQVQAQYEQVQQQYEQVQQQLNTEQVWKSLNPQIMLLMSCMFHRTNCLHLTRSRKNSVCNWHLFKHNSVMLKKKSKPRKKTAGIV